MQKIYTVTLPDIGEGVVEGEVIEWIKNVGEHLKQDEPVVVVMTDKATVELPAPFAGTLHKQYYQRGGISIRGQPLYDIELDRPQDDEISDKPEDSPLPSRNEVSPETKTAEVVRPKRALSSTSQGEETPCVRGTVKATPPVRALAKQMGIDLSQIQGSGKEGRVLRQDLVKTPPSEQLLHLEQDKIEPLLGIHSLMAKKMATSKAHIPHFSYFEQVEVERLTQLRQNTQKLAGTVGVHLTYMPFFIRALSLCLKKYPQLNSCFDSSANALIMHAAHNIGIAMHSRHGLIVPVLKNVQSMSLEDLIRAYDDLHQRATQNKLAPAEMKEGTISLSNFGLISNLNTWATPIINYPEVAILALSRIHPQPVVKNEAVVVRQVINLSWSFDHRVIDGATATHISHDFCSYILNPAALL